MVTNGTVTRIGVSGDRRKIQSKSKTELKIHGFLFKTKARLHS